jgi:hypothetical protein
MRRNGKDGEMITLSVASKRTGVPRSTLRYAARTGRLKATLIETELGVPVYKTTIEAVLEFERTLKVGRPRKKT